MKKESQKGSYDEARAKRALIIKELTKKHTDIGTWLIGSKTTHPDWDKKVREYNMLAEEITIRQEQLKQCHPPTASVASKYSDTFIHV